MKSLTLVPLLLFTLTVTAHAQTTDPIALYDRAVERMSAVESMACSTTVYLRSFKGPSATSHFSVKMERLAEDPLFGYRFRIETGKGNVIIWDGSASHALFSDQQKIVRAEGMESGWLRTLDLSINRLLYWSLIGGGSFARDTANKKMRYSYIGRETLHGTLCEVVRIDHDDENGLSNIHALIWLGVDDLLPRRRMSCYTSDGKHDTTRLDWSDLRPGIKFSAETFTLTTPDGFTVEAYKPPARPLLATGSAAPDWRLARHGGDSVSLSSLRGKVVVLDFWATWCGPCRDAMPGLQRLHAAYDGRDVVVLGINAFERSGDPAKVMESKGCTYGLLLGGNEVATQYKASTLPTLYVIGRDGTIAGAIRGHSEGVEKSVAEIIERELSK